VVADRGREEAAGLSGGDPAAAGKLRVLLRLAAPFVTVHGGTAPGSSMSDRHAGRATWCPQAGHVAARTSSSLSELGAMRVLGVRKLQRRDQRGPGARRAKPANIVERARAPCDGARQTWARLA
jgi:hypothetical protein